MTNTSRKPTVGNGLALLGVELPTEVGIGDMLLGPNLAMVMTEDGWRPLSEESTLERQAEQLLTGQEP